MLEEGAIIDGKYQIRRLIGEGGMGSVFEGHAVRLHRRVAVKVLRAGLNNEAEIASRLQLEAQAAGRIGSRHVVDVLDLGQLPSGAPYLVMEFLAGESLSQRIRASGALSPDQIRAIGVQLLDGIAAAHAAGVIHRDLKPDNVFLVRQPDGTDFVKILDFGISKFSQGAADLALTRTGALMGTPSYLSPEQASGDSGIDERTDLYAVGVILYECLTGALPYDAESFNELLFKIVLGSPIPVRERVPDADPAFVALVERAMHKQPHERFQSASDMTLALDAWAGGTAYVAPQGTLLEPRSKGGRPAAASSPFIPHARASQNPANAGPGMLDSWARGGASATLKPEPRPRRKAIVWAALVAVTCLAAAALLWSAVSKSPPALATTSSAAALPVPVVEPVHVAAAPNALGGAEPIGGSTPSLPAADEPSPEEQAQFPSAPSVPGSAHARTVHARTVPARTVRPSNVLAAPASSQSPPSPAGTDSDVARTRSGRAIRSDL